MTADLTKCTAEGCIARDSCLRCVAPVTSDFQAWIAPPGKDENCPGYIPYEEDQRR